MYGVYYTPMVEEWDGECPHGFTVHYEHDDCPGFRETSRWTDCPWCKMRDRYIGYANNVMYASRYALDTVMDAARANGERMPCSAMCDRMAQDKDVLSWFGYQGLLRGLWTPKMHTVWNNWLSRRFF